MLFYSAFLLGLVSSLHCVAMCGPIAAMLPVDRTNIMRQALQIFIYHCGRLTAYATIGMCFGFLGRGFYMAGIQQHLSIFAGCMMTAIAIMPIKFFARYNFSGPVFKTITAIKSNLGKQFKKKSYSAIYSIGLLNGFLPCGMVYAALFGALSTQHVSWGILYMLLFGAGTIPLMAGISYLQIFFTTPLRNRMQKIIPYALAAIGILFIIRGMGMHIAYVSPEMTSLFVKRMPDCH